QKPRRLEQRHRTGVVVDDVEHRRQRGDQGEGDEGEARGAAAPGQRRRGGGEDARCPFAVRGPDGGQGFAGGAVQFLEEEGLWHESGPCGARRDSRANVVRNGPAIKDGVPSRRETPRGGGKLFGVWPASGGDPLPCKWEGL